MKSFLRIMSLCCVVLAIFACQGGKSKSALTQSGLNPANFEAEVNGKATHLYTLVNANGMEVCVTNFGGRIVSIMVPDKNGINRDVVLGFGDIKSYMTVSSDFGASIGRYANRINQGKIVLDGVEYQLPQNNFGHCLHGGCTLEPTPMGWQYMVYDAEQTGDNQIKLSIVSPDGEAGFPGNVTATVTYTLTDDNSIDIKYEATTDKKTVINMTNHSYFNLSGEASHPITDCILTINADNFTPVDSTYMTTGEIIPVEGTPMDFRSKKTIGSEIDNFEYVQLKNGNGYDHNWVLNTAGDDTQVAVRAYSPESGITLEVYTDEPGIQVYTGNFLDGTAIGKNQIAYQKRTGFCLETQKYPDTPNKPEWPSAVLEPGQTYTSHCIFKFGAE